MTKGDEVTITTKNEQKISGTIRSTFQTFVIVDDDKFRPKVVLKSDIVHVSPNS